MRIVNTKLQDMEKIRFDVADMMGGMVKKIAVMKKSLKLARIKSWKLQKMS